MDKLLKLLKKVLPWVAGFFIVAFIGVSLYDWIICDVVTTIAMLKFLVVTLIVLIITLIVCGIITVGDVKEKASKGAKAAKREAKKARRASWCDTLLAIIYVVLSFIAVMMIGTMLGVRFEWQNSVTGWIANTFDEARFFLHDVVTLVVVFLFDKVAS